MSTLTHPDSTFFGESIDPDNRGTLADCTHLLGDSAALRSHIAEKGYVYLPGYLGRERVLEARRVVVKRLAEQGVLDPAHDPMDAILKPGAKPGGFAGGVLSKMFPNDWRTIHSILYDGPMIDFFTRLFDGAAVRHYDYTWFRLVPPGPSTRFHSDVVYMGRGTHELFTAWTPLGDYESNDEGGLILLEGSNNHSGLQKSYLKDDVDSFCENRTDKRDGWQKGRGGWLKASAKIMQHAVGGKWVTSDYRAGDVVIFSVYIVHGGTDNHSKSFRMSTDTRYQRADAPVDNRWVGENPPGHGPKGKRGRVC